MNGESVPSLCRFLHTRPVRTRTSGRAAAAAGSGQRDGRLRGAGIGTAPRASDKRAMPDAGRRPGLGPARPAA